jgi:predicted AAA+ superfamily ATPase
MWIKRDFESIIVGNTSSGHILNVFPVWLFLGPRQVGKSSLLKHCSGSDRTYINLDDLNIRLRANEDPEFFLSQYPGPLLIDEIQYAPALLSILKRRADDNPRQAGLVWLTGSQSFEMMRGVRETLAGRIAILNLFGLSNHEKQKTPQNSAEYFAGIVETTFPKLFEVQNEDTRAIYLSSYVETFILRDVQELIEIKKRREFEIFLKICALRTGQIIDYESLGRDAGVSSNTAKQWLNVLESSFLIHLVHPYFSNRTKRLIKSPKLYFNDMGLAAYLAGWRNSEMLRLGPMGGAALETQVFGDLIRLFKHHVQDAQFHFWRTKDGQEIDLLVETKGMIFPLEIKMGTPKLKTLPSLESIAEPNWKDGKVLTLLPKSEHVEIAPSWRLQSILDSSTLPKLFEI